MWAAGHPAWVSPCHLHSFVGSFRRICLSSKVSGHSYAPVGAALSPAAGGCSANLSIPPPQRPSVPCRGLQDQQAGSFAVRISAGDSVSRSSRRRQLQPPASAPVRDLQGQRTPTQRQLEIHAPPLEARTKVVNGVYGADPGDQHAISRGPGLPEVDMISSSSNAYVKHLVRLRSSAPYRRELRRGLLVGLELLKEASGDPRDPLRVRVLLLQEGLSQLPRGVVAERVVRVTEAVLKKVSGVESAGGVEAVAELDLPPNKSLRELLSELKGNGITTSTPTTPTATIHYPSIQFATAGSVTLPTSATTSVVSPVRLLVLDGVQDPGNLGTLARSALAFGWGGLFLLHGCCDPFNDKAVRASRGALLRLPLAAGSLEELREAAREAGLLLLSADMEEREEQKEEGEEAKGAGVQESWGIREEDKREEAGRREARSCLVGEPRAGLLESGGLLELLKGRGGSTSRSSSNSSSFVQDPQGGASGRTIPSVKPLGKETGTAVYAATSAATPAALGGVALVLGNEGAGLSPAVRQLCVPVSVPMEGEMESLNVGVAGAILMFALSQGPPTLFKKLAARLRAANGAMVE